MILNTHPENRKEMVKAICEPTGMNATYLFTPTYAYQVGPITVRRDGSIVCEDEAMLSTIKPMLIERGWLEAEETPEAPADFKVMPETEAPISVEQMDITMPIPGWTVAQMANALQALHGVSPRRERGPGDRGSGGQNRSRHFQALSGGSDEHDDCEGAE